MDSIFEQPRTTPKPTPVTQNFKAPIVPEASLIFQNTNKDIQSNAKSTQSIPPRHQSYNAWKLQNSQQSDAHDSFVSNNKSNEKENMCQNYANYQYAYVSKTPCDLSNKSLFKKQVRFERPMSAQPQVVMSSPNFHVLLKNPKDKIETVRDLHVKKSENSNCVTSVAAQYVAPITNIYRAPLQSRNVQGHNDSLAAAVVNTPEKQRCQVRMPPPNRCTPEYIPTSNGSKFPYSDKLQINPSHIQQKLICENKKQYTETDPNILFERSTLNGIKKYSAPTHILQQKPLKATENNPGLNTNLPDMQNMLFERKVLPNLNYDNKSQSIETDPKIFERRSPLNSEGIKKNSSPPGHVLQQEQVKTFENNTGFNINIQDMQNRLCEQKTLPTYTQPVFDSKILKGIEPILPDRTLSNNCQKVLSDHAFNINNTGDTNNQSDSNIPEKKIESPKTCSCNCKSAPKQNEDVSSDKENSEPKAQGYRDPSVAELLNIVKMQNDQLKLLQNQVQMLIKMNETNKKRDFEDIIENLTKIEKKADTINQKVNQESPVSKQLEIYKSKLKANNDNHRKKSVRTNEKQQKHERNSQKNVVIYKDEQVGTSYDEGICKRITRGNIITTDTKTEKISVGIMTSFQVSLKSPVHNKKTRKRYNSRETSTSISEDDFQNYADNKVFTDTWHNKNDRMKMDTGTSMSNETITQDDEYSLDEIGLEEELQIEEPAVSPNHTIHVDMQDYDSDSDDETSTTDPGWTFYNNILGNVNHILENSPSQGSDRENRNRRKPQTKQATDTTMDIIAKQEFCGRFKNIENLKPNEISFAVKQLLMKYMSDEDLANIINRQEGNRMEKAESDTGSNTNRCRKEYRNSTTPEGHRQQVKVPKNQTKQIKQIKSSMKPKPPSISNGAKILDITTLKKQPKLL